MPSGLEKTQNNSIKKPPKATMSNLRPNKITQDSLNTARRRMTIFMRGRDGDTFMIPSLLQTIYAFTTPKAALGEIPQWHHHPT